MIVFPNAKINLGLNVVGKRNDGYHNIWSIFYPVGIYDGLEFTESEKLKTDVFEYSGLEIPGVGELNLCVRALQLIRKTTLVPALRVHLHKTIPMGAGLGGGSADAGFFLKALNSHFNLKIGGTPLRQMAMCLGSDCGFFIDNRPAFVTGRGEKIEFIEPFLSGKILAVVFNRVHISTAAAYSQMKLKQPEFTPIEVVRNKPVGEWKDFLTNDFEEIVFRNHPELARVKDLLYQAGAVYASMTGSGSAIYGIFDSPPSMDAHFPKGNYQIVNL